MSWIPDRYRELRSLLGRASIEDEVDEELGVHVDLRTADLEAAGLSAAAAREEAHRRFGDVKTFRAQLCAID
jgi:putative ABC transport system permease protein